MIILSIVAVPLVLMEYYFTRERIIEDIALEQGIDRENNIPLKEQMKALFTNKYWVARYRCIPDIPDIQKSRNKESDRRRIFARAYRQHHRLDISG